MKIRSDEAGEYRELPQCSKCKRPVFTLWDAEGRCITCSRNATLGESPPPVAGATLSDSRVTASGGL